MALFNKKFREFFITPPKRKRFSVALIKVHQMRPSRACAMEAYSNANALRIKNVLAAALLTFLWLTPTISHAQCSNPAGNEGETMYNKDFSVMQYCDDTNWIAMGNADTGLIGYWRLDETSGTTAIDSSVNANNGTMNGGLDASNDSVTGVIQNALHFDGTNDYVDSGFAPVYSATDDFSYAAWFKLDVTGGGTDDGIFTAYSGATTRVAMEIDTDGSVCTAGEVFVTVRDNGPGADSVCGGFGNDTEWHHAASTYDADGNLLLYIDGVLADTDPVSGSVGVKDFTGNPLSIGATNNNGTRQEYFDGVIDDVRAYDRVLLPAEVTRLYNAGRDRGLVGHWKLDETGATTTAIDSSVNGNDGTMTNGLDGTDSVPGKIDTALDFTGANARAEVSHDTSLTPPNDDITISLWVNPSVDWNDEPNDIWRLIEKTSTSASTDPGFGMGIQGFFGEAIAFNVGNGVDNRFANSGALNWSADKWYHITVTYDGSTVTTSFYRDGAFINNSVGAAFAPDWGTDDLHIGDGPANNDLDGYMDDVRIYHRVLSASEVQALYREKFTMCASPDGYEGEIIYNDANDVMQFCNSAAWMGMGPAGDGGAGCSNPTGSAGDMIYNDGATVMTYCEGDEWIAIGK